MAGGDLKGIMIHETRSSFDRTRNSAGAAFPQAVNQYATPDRVNEEDSAAMLPSGPDMALQGIIPKPGQLMGPFKRQSSQLRGQRELILQSHNTSGNQMTAMAK